MLCSLFKRQCRDVLFFGVSQMLAHMHLIAVVAVVQHALGNGGWRVLVVGQYTDFACPLNQCFVKFGPGTPR